MDNYRDTVDCCVIIHKFRCLTQLSEKKGFMGFVISLLSTLCLFAASSRRCFCWGATPFFVNYLSWNLRKWNNIFKKVLLYKFGCHTSPTIKTSFPALLLLVERITVMNIKRRTRQIHQIVYRNITTTRVKLPRHARGNIFKWNDNNNTADEYIIAKHVICYEFYRT